MRSSIKRIAVVGGGLIGGGWSSWFLASGLDVICTDPAAGAEERLRSDIAANLSQIGQSAAQGLSKFRFETDLAQAVMLADWVQESTPEDIILKRRIIHDIDQAAPADVVIASSTSSIKVSDLQAGTSRPQRIISGHPFLPVTLIPLVEIAGGQLTSETALDVAMAFYRSIGKQPVRLRREISGHIANRLQAALMREAFFLLQEGIASASDIDLALTEGPGLRWAATGPFVSHHLAGGAGGARQAFAKLGHALTNMWGDLGVPVLTPELEALVVREVDACLAHKPEALWVEERLQVFRAIQREKTRLEDEPEPGKASSV